MPSLGADMDSGTLLEWLVKPGDEVHRGQVIAVVDTDKAAIEVECFDDGTIERLLVDPGQKVAVGTALASIGAGAGIAAPVAVEPAPSVVPAPVAPAPVVPAAGAAQITSPLVRHLAEERGVDLGALTGSGPGGVVHRADVEHAAPAAPPATSPAAPPLVAPPAEPVRHNGLRASPMARRLAAGEHLDLSGVTGTGPGGAIGVEDVRRALAAAARQAGTAATEAPAPPPPPPPPAAAPAAAAPAPAAAVHEASGQDRWEMMRHAIAALMSRSNRDIPHYYLTTTIDMTAATEWLRVRNRELPVEGRLVPAALLLKATALAARAVPQMNGTWEDDAFHPADRVDLGLVISLRRGGIIVPVITEATERTVDDIMAQVRGLVERARTGRLRGSELRPPTITVSNLGEQGVESVLGVIYPPQVALVGLGAVLERPWAVNGLLGVRPLVTASLAADHRASDGAIGARFLNRIDKLLQTPEEL